MMNKKLKWAIGIGVGALVIALIVVKLVDGNNAGGKLVPVQAAVGEIRVTVGTSGTVKPQNRLEIKPPITGRIEKILVTEGQEVVEGEVLALMSSTERATLIDAARLKGKGEYAYWQKAYKETPLISPIDGVVIVRDVEPGQTVSTGDAVLVLSDRLIVEADVDETDIGELEVGQRATITLDAYPDIEIDAVVDHISYESEVVNNVTIYKVDVLPTKVPDVFRSGMSANVEVVVREVEGALLIPADAPTRKGEAAFVRIRDPETGELVEREITTGLESEGQVQVVSGLEPGEVVYVSRKAYRVPTMKNGGTPFLPRFRRNEEKSKR